MSKLDAELEREMEQDLCALDEMELAEIALAKAEAREAQAKAALAHVEARLKEQQYDSAKIREDIEAATDYRHGHIVFTAEVDEHTVDQLTGQLRRMERLFPGKTITIELNTPGGDIIAGLHLFDEIRRIIEGGTLVNIRVRGEAASMGGILLQAGHHRTIGRNAWVMLHRYRGAAQGTADEIEDSVKMGQRLEQALYRILAERTKKSASWWKKRLGDRKDAWFDAEEALELGLVDAIG